MEHRMNFNFRVNLTTLSVAYVKQHQILIELLLNSLGSVWNIGRMAQFELLSRGNYQQGLRKITKNLI
jgi:hypothetical protein